ncbi:MAG: DUF3859 domain-containing protein [Bacteroidales bacterium]|nr:DUF3859 domain-containing protein [Bacteroidales bacterium]
MKSIITFLLIIICLGLISCKLRKQSPVDISIKELNYGPSNAKILATQQLENSPSEEHLTTDYKLNIIRRTDTIDAKLGAQFGVEFITRCRTDKPHVITTVWKYPKGMKNNKGEAISETRYEILRPVNVYDYTNYTLTEPNEVVKGLWTLELYSQSKLLYSRTFYLR